MYYLVFGLSNMKKCLLLILCGVLWWLWFLCGLCGCGSFSTIPVQQSPHTTRTRSINEMVDAKVARELPKALSAIVGQNVIDYGPYAMLVLLSILLGKKHVDLKKIANISKVFGKKV